MNILFISRLFFPHIGGVETHVLKLSQELINHQHTITILTSQHDRKLPLNQTHQNLNIIRIPNDCLTSKLKLWHWMLIHKDLIFKFQIVHVHDVFWWYLPLKILYPHKLVFTTFHGWEGHFPPTKKEIIWKQVAYRLSKSSIVVGEYINIWYKINCPIITYGATDQKKLPPFPAPNILVYGRLDSDNDMKLVFQALREVKDYLRSVKISFLGDGSFSSEARQLGTVVGFSPNTSTYLKQSSIVITSSYLSMIDSFAAGRHVFSAYSNPLKKDYLVRHPIRNHFYISSNPRMLAKRLIQVITHPKNFENNLHIAQDWAHKQTWQKLSATYLKLWNIT